MDYSVIQGAIVSLKAAGDIAVTFGKVKTMAEVQSKSIELQQIILAAQSSALTAQSQQFALLEEIRGLKEEVARVKAWDEEKERYALVPIFTGAVAYALKRERSNGQPPHWICAHCYEQGRKSSLNPSQNAKQNAVLTCPTCRSHIESPYRTTTPLKYAEDKLAQEGSQ